MDNAVPGFRPGDSVLRVLFDGFVFVIFQDARLRDGNGHRAVRLPASDAKDSKKDNDCNSGAACTHPYSAGSFAGHRSDHIKRKELFIVAGKTGSRQCACSPATAA